MSLYEFSISYSHILFFIERIRRAKTIAVLTGPYVNNLALMAKDSIRMNIIRLHSAIDVVVPKIEAFVLKVLGFSSRR